MAQNIYRIILVSSALALSACSQAFHASTDAVATRVADQVGCADLKSALWTELYSLADDPKGYPTVDEMRAALRSKLEKRMSDRSVADRLASEASGLYGLVVESATRESSGDIRRVISKLVALELGDEHTVDLASAQISLKQSFASIDSLVTEASVQCSNPPPTGSGTPPPGAGPTPAPTPMRDSPSEGAMLDAWKDRMPAAVYGAWKTMSVAYQSCDAVALGALMDATPDVLGIYVNPNKHSSSGGKWREIDDLTLFLKTQPYLHVYRKPDPSCFDVQTRPLIYDFGGKPAYSGSITSDLDLFSENGTGATNQLGIDCSGFVTTSILTAGLKLSSKDPQRPQFVSEIPARNFMNPDGDMKKLDCFDYLRVGDTVGIQPGDILASAGHVVMIDTVGRDPFGVARFQNKADCKASNIDPARFDFTIAHSGSAKNGIGISRMKASDYFNDGGDMSDALREYGTAACKAKFGEASAPKPSGAHIVRHLNTAKCMDRQVALRKSSCLASCR